MNTAETACRVAQDLAEYEAHMDANDQPEDFGQLVEDVIGQCDSDLEYSAKVGAVVGQCDEVQAAIGAFLFDYMPNPQPGLSEAKSMLEAANELYVVLHSSLQSEIEQDNAGDIL